MSGVSTASVDSLASFSLGVFASLAFNPAGAERAVQRQPAFLPRAARRRRISTVWAFVFTYGMLWIIDRITPVKVDEAGETAGLDMVLHGEVAYTEAL